MISSGGAAGLFGKNLKDFERLGLSHVYIYIIG